MSEDFQYTGTKTLEILQDAVNYNKFLEDELVAFIQPEKSAIDFGAGIGEFAKRVRFRGFDISCVEIDSEQQEYLRKNGLITHSTLEPYNSALRIYSLNVLEHIEDDVAILKEIYNKLEAGGKLFLYVPAFMCLYTDFDKYVGHYRRYTRKELNAKLSAAGFNIERSEYVDSAGFVCWFIMGRLPSDKTKLNPLMVKIFDRILFPLSRCADYLFNKFFGKNLLVVAQKTIIKKP